MHCLWLLVCYNSRAEGSQQRLGYCLQTQNIYCLSISRKCALTLCIRWWFWHTVQRPAFPDPRGDWILLSTLGEFPLHLFCSQTCLRYFSQTGLCQFTNHGWTHRIKWHSERQPDKNMFTHRRWRRFAFGLEWDVGKTGVWGWQYYLWGKVMRWGERAGEGRVSSLRHSAR